MNDPIIHEPYLQKFYKILDNVDRVATKTATLYIYDVPEWLPYFSVYLDQKGWQFKYWLALETQHVEKSTVPLVQSHTGILRIISKSRAMVGVHPRMHPEDWADTGICPYLLK